MTLAAIALHRPMAAGRLLTLVLLALLAAACSTTSRLGPNDVLYTGVKKLNYVRPDSVEPLDDGVKDQVFDIINVRPNNPLYSPYYRTPLPVGLWVYNHMDPDAKGFKGWIYKMLVSKPVLIRRVNPKQRVGTINELLRSNGYFNSEANYELNVGKDPKKASVTYTVSVTEPYRLGTIHYLGGTDDLERKIDSLARQSTYLRTGNRYCLDSLSAARINIANRLRDMGYYYYRPEYLQYLADSTSRAGVVDIRLSRAPDIPNQAERQYITGRITAVVMGSEGGDTPDTLTTSRGVHLVKLQPVHINNSIVPSNIVARSGRPFRVSSIDRSQALLSRLGIFSQIDMQAVDIDSLTPDGRGVLNLRAFCKLDRPWEIKCELQGVSKSNSFIGPGLEVGLSHNNLWGGAEKLSVDFNADYEWQTGRGSSYNGSSLNSYEFSIDTKLSIPRLLAPSFVDRSRRYLNWTRVSLNAGVMNRPDYFTMLQLGGTFSWEWHANRYSLNEFTPFKLTYNKLLHETTAFDSAMIANRALATSFEDVFVPMMQYSYTYDNHFGADHITWRSTVGEAGNICAGLWELCGQHGEKKMMGTPFSQFVKAETQLVWTRTFSPGNQLATRVNIGALYAYGNSTDAPFAEQFYIGGANSVRAFTVRTVGPGSYCPEYRSAYDYYDQTGTFKFEANAEWRFPLLGYFKGALFLDAGNIWLLKDDDCRPGGRLQMKNFLRELAVGTGVGLRFDMDMLVVRADLGIGLHLPYDTGRSGYYNMESFKRSLAFHLAIGYPF